MKQQIYKIVRVATLALSGTGIGKIVPLFRLYLIFLGKVKPKEVTTEGSRMILDERDSLLLSIYPTFEPGVVKTVRKLVKEGMVAVDCGAHIGVFTLLLSQLVGKKGKVYAIEPDKRNFALLGKNIELNGYKNVIARRAAITSKDGKVKLYVDDETPVDNRITFDASRSRKTESVDGVCIDSITKNKKIDFIKLDIQGAEILAMEGAEKVLRKNKKLIMVVEFWPYGLSRSGKSPNDLIKILQKYGTIKYLHTYTGTLTKFKNEDFEKYNDTEDFGPELLFIHK